MSTPHDGGHDRRFSERRGGVAGIDEPTGAGEEAEDLRPGRHEGNHRATGAEPGRTEEYPDHNPLYAPGYGPPPGGQPADHGAAPPYQEPPPGFWEQPPDGGHQPPPGDWDAGPAAPPDAPSWLPQGPAPGYPGDRPDLAGTAGMPATPDLPGPPPPPPPSDLTAGHVPQHLGPDTTAPPDPDFGSSAGSFGAGSYGSGAESGAGAEFGAADQPGIQPGAAGAGYGSPGGDFGTAGHPFSPAPDPGFGREDFRAPDQGEQPGQPFGGHSGPPPAEGFAPYGGFGPHGGFGATGEDPGGPATAGMPPAPPDVPVPPGMTIPPPGEPVHIEADPSDFAGLRDGISRPAAGDDAPTLVGQAPTGAPPASRSEPRRTARMPRPRVQAPGLEGPPGRRRAHVAVSRVEPLSMMKFSFVVSVVAFIVLFVAVAVLYGILAGLGVFDSLQKTIESLTSGQGAAGVNAAQWFSASRILGYAALIGAVNIILITALSTVGAVLYNAAAHLIGGVEVTLDETE